ncbi:hypothetical protein MLD38_010759 [Melastoma candidum]|uniref:Uncharacterized protein n=1 Tax=Melastoma candidum TaxID=119954 RepID=A0ACB9R267_9MYRT|nr:hypothetical protein MLD38_010759 [Melastoma candidum]
MVEEADKLPCLRFSQYNALDLSMSRVSHGYTLSVVKSKQVPGDFSRWDLSIPKYDSETNDMGNILYGSSDRIDVWEGIGKRLDGVPHKLFRGFGKLDDVFSSSRNDELIYIDCGGPSLLVFDLNEKR